LQIGDVVAAHHRLALVQPPVAEPVSGLDDRRPGLLAADPVDPQAARRLKCADRPMCRGPERADLVAFVPEAEAAQPSLQIADWFATRARTERQDPKGV
jgi:hypothetical protein